MTLAELRDKANAKLADMWPVIQAKEDAYFAKHGYYFGLRWSPEIEVVDGVDTDLVLNRPSRFHEAADVQFPATQVPYQIMIERINQQKPRNTAVWDFQGELPAPIWGETEEVYKVWVRIKLPNGDVWVRTRDKNNVDSGWFQQITI